MNEFRLTSGFLIVSSFCLAASLAACSSEDPEDGGGTGGGAMSTGGSSSGTGGAGTGGAGTGGEASGTGGSTSGGEQFPAETTVAGIEAFLATESYKSWTHDPAPRGPVVGFATHSPQMQVYFNDLAVQNHAAVPVGGMLIKELYDESGTLIGKAASLKTSADADMWTFYCKTDDAVAGCQASGDQPFYFVHEFIQGCAACHGDAVLTPLP